MAAIGTRKLKITVGGVERNLELATCEVVPDEADSDFTTFADADQGGSRQYGLHIVAVQDAAVGTLLDLVWSSLGSTVACVMKPYGNAAPSAAQPHYTMNAVVAEPNGSPLIGGQADKSTSAKMSFEATWQLEAKPVKVTV